MSDRLEEIKNRLHAWVHWQRAAGNSVDETHAPDMQWLIDQLAAITAERDESRTECVGALTKAMDEATFHYREIAACESQRDATLARVVQLEGALRFYADVNNWFLEKTYTGASQICIRGNDRSDVDQGDEVYTCGGKRARAALSQSSGAELQAIRQAQGLLKGHRFNWHEGECMTECRRVCEALKALTDAFGEGEEE